MHRTHQTPPHQQPAPLQVLQGTRILSLALNLPGPAALMRCRHMGAQCVKLEPPSGDPMRHYSPAAYAELHQGIEVVQADLKSEAGQDVLHQRLASTDVLLTSFRPSAIEKLGLGWTALQQRHPSLSHVAIVGSPGPDAEQPGHDLTYLAREGLVSDLALPSTLFADMGGSLLASEAVLQAVLLKRGSPSGASNASGTSSALSASGAQGTLSALGTRGVHVEVALSSAAHYLAMPRRWGLTLPAGTVGGAHAGYAVYACQDGRVAVAALEPHFARSLGRAAGLGEVSTQDLMTPGAHAQLKAFFASKSRQQLDALAEAEDIPLLTLAAMAD